MIHLLRLFRRYRPLRSILSPVWVVVFVSLMAFEPDRLVAQSRQGSGTSDTQTENVAVQPLVTDVSFTGRPFFDDDQLRLHIRTRPNRKLMGIPGFTWWLWVYRFGANTLGGRLGKAFRDSGEPPAILDSTVIAGDIERLRLFFEREGFRKARVTVEIHPVRRTRKVDVVFNIDSGDPTWIRTLRYNGLDALDPDQKIGIARESLLQPRIIDESSPLTYHPDRQRYSEPVLLEEGSRLMATLRNEGYAVVGRDSIHAVVYPISEDSFDVTIDVKLGPRFRFGDIFFNVQGPEESESVRFFSDTLKTSESPGDGGIVAGEFRDEHRLDFDVVTRTLQFKSGDWYDRSRILATKRRLDATGLFAFTEILAVPVDSNRLEVNSDPRLSHRFNLQTRKRHQIRLQTFMLQRSGPLADADNELGTGLGITYNNLNLFGGGEAFQVKSTGSIAVDLGGKGGFTSAQWEVAASLGYPYLTFPFGRLDRWLNLYSARSSFSVSLLAARRDALSLIIRGRGSARYRFELRHSRTLTSILDLLDLTVSSPDTLDGFRKLFLNDILRSVVDPVQRAKIIEDYTVPQFNDAVRYTFRSSRLNPFRRENGYSHELSLELGGNLGYLLDRFIYSPGTLEGNLPGLPFFRGRSVGNRMIYRQYVRFSGDLRSFTRLSSSTVFAGKFMLGVAQPIGRADVIPFDRRFYSGGASSVRGWRLRELGPGAASFVSEADSSGGAGSTNLLGGEIKLEANAELRRTMVRNLFAADWIVAMFTDVGNVWFGPRNPGTAAGRFRIRGFAGDLGVGSGVGLRIAWEYLIIRLDLAYKVHDPLRRGVLLPDGLRKPLLHFGIGHTF